MLGDLSSWEAQIQKNLDRAPWQRILSEVPDNPVLWNSDSVILMEPENFLERFFLKVTVYSGQPAPRERLKVIAHCPLEIILWMLLRMHIKLLIEESHEV